MMFTLIFYNILLIPIVFGSNSTTRADHSLALNLLTKETPKVEPDPAKLNLSLITEGGSVAASPSPTSSAPKHQHALLMTLDKEFGKDKTVGTSDSKVKPRKGVVYHDDNDTVPEANGHIKPKNISLTELSDIKVIETHSIEHNVTEKPHSPSEVEPMTTPKLLNHTLPAQKLKLNTTTTTIGVDSKLIINTTLHKKPTVLSNEALDKIVFSNNDVKLSAIGSSAKTVVTNQIPLPNGVNKRTESVHSRQPGMVMPVVITILVVPILAVLGYMALKRGREAWKNRHYKRMDFLLDGMYND